MKETGGCWAQKVVVGPSVRPSVGRCRPRITAMTMTTAAKNALHDLEERRGEERDVAERRGSGLASEGRRGEEDEREKRHRRSGKWNGEKEMLRKAEGKKGSQERAKTERGREAAPLPLHCDLLSYCRRERSTYEPSHLFTSLLKTIISTKSLETHFWGYRENN